MKTFDTELDKKQYFELMITEYIKEAQLMIENEKYDMVSHCLETAKVYSERLENLEKGGK